MKPLHKIFAITLLGCFLITTPNFSQNDNPSYKVKKVREATDEVREATNKIKELARDCEKNKSKIKEQVKDAKKALEECEEYVGKAKTEAAKKGDSDIPKEVQDSLESAQKMLKEALDKLEGIKSADDIISELDGADTSSDLRNRRAKKKEEESKKNAIDALKNEAEEAGYKNPCDSSNVRHLVREKIKKMKASMPDDLKDWLEELRKSLKASELISIPAEDDRYLFTEMLLYKEPKRPRYAVEIYGSQYFTPSDMTQRHLDRLYKTMVDHVYTDPTTFKNLAEMLNGEFAFGGLAGEAKPVFEAPKNTRAIGLGGQINLTENWMLEASINRAKSEASARFPVTVFGGYTGETSTLEGFLRLQLTWLRYALGGGYRAGQGTVRPFTTCGIQFTKTNIAGSEGRIGDILLPPGLHTDTSQFSIGAYGTAGMEIHTGSGLYFTTCLTGAWEKQKGGSLEEATVFVPGVRVGAGWQF